MSHNEELFSEIERASQNTKHLQAFVDKYKKIVLLGAGSASAFCSIVAKDYAKTLGKTVYTFSDSAKVLAYMEDYGPANANEKFLKEHSDKDTLVILVSSSQNTESLYRAALHCGENFLPTVVLTGPEENNKLAGFDFPSRLFHLCVNSNRKSVVDCVHWMFLMSIVE
ncbi:MAG: hypothetical protein WC761_00565 [Candidatus Paceibacterota bacterium]